MKPAAPFRRSPTTTAGPFKEGRRRRGSTSPSRTGDKVMATAKAEATTTASSTVLPADPTSGRNALDRSRWTDRRLTKALLDASALWGRRYNNLHIWFIMTSPPWGEALSDDARLTSFCRVHRPKSRTERPRKTKIGTEVSHVKRDSDTTFKVARSKVNLQGAGSYCGGLADSLFQFIIFGAILIALRTKTLTKCAEMTCTR